MTCIRLCLICRLINARLHYCIDVMITVQGRGVASCVSNEVCPVFIGPYRGFHCGCRRVFSLSCLLVMITVSCECVAEETSYIAALATAAFIFVSWRMT